MIVIEQSSAGEPWRTAAAVANWATWLVFLAEVVALAAVAPYPGRWLLAHPLDVALVLISRQSCRRACKPHAYSAPGDLVYRFAAAATIALVSLFAAAGATSAIGPPAK